MSFDSSERPLPGGYFSVMIVRAFFRRSSMDLEEIFVL
jgi:hypothetical protein